MPVKVERTLKKEARAKGIKPGTKRYGRYVYGTLSRLKKKRKERKKRRG